MLRAAVPLHGRSVPVLFAAYRKWQLRTSQHDLEEAFLRVLREALPPRTEAVLICDRGSTGPSWPPPSISWGSTT